MYRKSQVDAYPIDHPRKDLGKNNLVKQDNISTTKMVKGGMRIYGARTRSIHIRFFYAIERMNDGTIVVTYCPTKRC